MLLVKNLVFTVLVPGTVAFYVPVFVLPHPPPAVSIPSLLAGGLLLLGASVYAWCVWHFATEGRGTPAPIDPPRALVARGPYRYTRNPMYLGVLCVLAGWALLFRSPGHAVYAVAMAGAFHLFVRFYEEPTLSNRFGESYERYRARVPRWLPLRRRGRAG